jgi:alkanesulfonate monooxygenase SsuD/methylene tetrahydromethanopterin reductase-like flavin-dependent oxidoreductase (luciferase family)
LRERERGSGRRTPVLIAAGGPRARALAAAKADIVTLGVSPLASRDEISALVADLQAHAPDPDNPPELATNLFVIGDEVPPEIGRYVGASAAELIEVDSLAMLRGSVTEMCDELQRRRERFGASYVLVNVAFAERFAPVLERLAGH